jgi:predicted transcriptional regulator
MENKNQANLAELTSDIVSAFVSNNPIPLANCLS